MPRGTGGAASAGIGGSSNGGGPGTTVINRGQVGIFDWVLLQATSSAAFTDWLTANGFPYSATSQTAFSYYVSTGWYFVAFKVSAGTGGTGAGGAGGSGATGGFTIPRTIPPVTTGGTGGTSTSTGTTRICGNLGPVMLSFASATQPVVPARIAAVSSNQLNWMLYTLAAEQMRLRDYPSTLRFSGALATSDLDTYPSLAPIAQAGDRLTELLISLPSSTTSDLVLEPDPNQADYRRTEIHTVYVTCTTGGTTSTSTSAGTGGIVYGTGGTPFGYGGSVTTGGQMYAGDTTSAGGTANNGGAADSGGTPPTGGAISTGGVLAVGGQLGTGGLAPTGGVSGNGGTSSIGGSNAASGSPGTGGVKAAAGHSSVGGAPNTAGSSAQGQQNPSQKDDDGGCAVRRPSNRSSSTGAGLLVALLSLGAFTRRRRPPRRK